MFCRVLGSTIDSNEFGTVSADDPLTFDRAED
jgi:hypothetical protein